MTTVNDTRRRVVLSAAWVLLVALIAAGGAGFVAGIDHVPGTAARPELTWAGDQAANSELDTARDELAGIAVLVEELGTLSCGALAAIIGREIEVVDATVTDGTGVTAEIRRRTTDLAAALADVPGVTDPAAALLVSPETRLRHVALVAAAEATAGLDNAWARFTSGAITATRLSIFLEEHDAVMGEAAAAGRAAEYASALELIAAAESTIVSSRAMRTVLANTVDVTVLDEWIVRNAAYDTALRSLYEALVESGGRVTDAVRAARAAEEAARARLPPDSRGLVVIMAEIGRGGMNGAVITIEEARGRLATALASLDDGLDDGPTPPP